MFARAYYDGDSDGMRRAIQRMTEYNRLYPQTPILLNNLMQSLRRRSKNRSPYHGLTLNPKHRASLIREAERFETQSSAFKKAPTLGRASVGRTIYSVISKEKYYILCVSPISCGSPNTQA